MEAQNASFKGLYYILKYIKALLYSIFLYIKNKLMLKFYANTL